MKPNPAHIAVLLATAMLLAVCPAGSLAQDAERSREIGRTTEREIKVVLSSSFGNIAISRGESGKIVSVRNLDPSNAPPRITMDYTVRNRIGYLEVGLGTDGEQGGRKKGRIRVEHLEQGTWTLQFSDALPISFDVELGIGTGRFDMTGLQVKDFNLSTGASEVEMSFDEENALEIQNLNIESGMSRFDGHNLLNARFKHFRFQGGVGSYTLDFGGTLRSEVEVEVEVGLGFATLIIPKDVGARLIYEKNWVSRLDCDADFESNTESEYLSTNYYRAPGKMNITLNSGLGSIKVRRR
jgi:hypothetical protein